MRDKGAVLHVTTTVLCSIALASIFIRLLGNPTSEKKKKWIQVADDWYMVANTVSTLPTLAPLAQSLGLVLTDPGIARWHDGVHDTQSVDHV